MFSLKASFCLSMQRVLKWNGEVPVSKISCVIASFLGTMEMPDETQLGQTNFFKCQDFPYTNIATWCHSVLDPVWRMYFDNYDYHMLLISIGQNQNPQIITQYFDINIEPLNIR